MNHWTQGDYVNCAHEKNESDVKHSKASHCALTLLFIPWSTLRNKLWGKKERERTWRNSLEHVAKSLLKESTHLKDLKILGFNIRQCSCLINREKHVDIPKGWKLYATQQIIISAPYMGGLCLILDRSTVYFMYFQEFSITLPPEFLSYLNILNKLCHKRKAHLSILP